MSKRSIVRTTATVTIAFLVLFFTQTALWAQQTGVKAGGQTETDAKVKVQSGEKTKVKASQNSNVSTDVQSQGQTRARVKAQSDTRSKAKIGGQSDKTDSESSAIVKSGTELSAILDTAISSRKNKLGDKFVMRTTKDLKLDNDVVIKKGTQLVGHVAEVENASKGKGISKLVLVFDEMQNKQLSAPLTATIMSITQVTHNSRLSSSDDDLFGSTSASGRARTTGSAGRGSSSGSNSGGLLGGVTSTVGGTVNSTVGASTDTLGGVTSTTTSTVDNTIKTTGQTVGNVSTTVNSTVNATTEATANTAGSVATGAGKATKSLVLTSSAEASGNSILMLQGKSLQLEKGTQFLLRLDKDVAINRQEK